MSRFATTLPLPARLGAGAADGSLDQTALDHVHA